MRIIKFRGKRLDNGAWETGGFVELLGSDMPHNHYVIDKRTGHHTPVIHETVGLFTGLFDKNGKEIYEGDVVQIGGLNGVIEYGCGRFGINWDYGTEKKSMLGSWGCEDNLRKIDDGYNRKIKVIDNIHDNHKLLKTK